MRQAGRYLEFEKLEKNPNFIELCLNGVSSEITITLRRFDLDLL